jgi:adenylyltransferase/sulfurtransferase
MPVFELSTTPIDAAALRDRLRRPDAGCLAVFEGWVRNSHRGRPVRGLEYEVFEEMALAEGRAIVEEAEARVPGTEVICVHRTGTAGIGEIAVWIGAASPHRAAAFSACRRVIEEIKRRLPVWKKEHFADGEPEWVDCTREHNPALRRDEYHSRQGRLPEFDAQAQARLAAANVLLVGAGGLGTVAADALLAAGVGRLTILDPDTVGLSNLARQPLYSAEDVGIHKAVASEARLRARQPFAEIDSVVGSLTGANAAALIRSRTAVLDCTDNFATRFILHDCCRALGVPLVQAAAIGWDGQVNTFDPASPDSGCMHCLWPGATPAALAAAGDCAGGAVFGPAVNTVGLIQATEAIKLVAGLPVVSAGRTLLASLLDYSVMAVERHARSDCPFCASKAPGSGVVAEQSGASDPILSTAQARQQRSNWRVLAFDPVPTGLLDSKWSVVAGAGLPWPDLRRCAEAGPTLVWCRRGLRSGEVVRQLRAEGIGDVFVLREETLAGEGS